MKRIVTSLFVALVLFQASAYAETVTGTVKNVSAADMKLTIARNDDNNDLPQNLDLVVQTDAHLKNIVSLKDLQAGNEVKVNVKQNKDARIWEAKSVELINMPASHTAAKY
jgi:hypothetical protein